MDMNTDIDPTDEIGCEEAPGFQDAEDAFDTYMAITTMRSEAARLRRERLEELDAELGSEAARLRRERLEELDAELDAELDGEDALAYFNPSATL